MRKWQIRYPEGEIKVLETDDYEDEDFVYDYAYHTYGKPEEIIEVIDYDDED